MINKAIKLAENLWWAIAEGNYNFWDIFMWNNLDVAGYIWYQIKPFKEMENTMSKWSGFLKSFASSSKNIYILSHGSKVDIKFIIWVPKELQTYFENIYFSYYDTSDLLFAKNNPSIQNIKFVDWKWANIYTDNDFTKNGQYLDPRRDVLSLYDNINQGNSLTILFIYKFGSKKSLLENIWNGISRVSSEIWEKWIDKVTEKIQIDNNIQLKFGVGYTTTIWDTYIRQQVENNLKSIFGKYSNKWSVWISTNNKLIDIYINQAVSFFHFLDKEHSINGLEYALYRKLSYPTNLPDFNKVSNKNELTVIWTTDYRYDKRLFGIKSEDKQRHMYIVGKTGTGKSKLIANLIKSDMISNKWLCLLDPHGDLVDDVLSQVPSYRVNDVVLFDVADTERPIGFNVFEYENESEKALIASWVVGIFKKLYDNSRWPRLEYILRNVILSILEYPNATLLHLVRMLTDNAFKEEVLVFVKDPILLKFWRDEFDKRQPKQKDEAIAPITNKVWQFVSSKIMRNIFWQWSTKMNMRKMMDEGKIILFNLSKGRIWEDSANMIGSFIVSKIQIDAMSRADIAEKDRREFYLYIDEFQNFATDSFETILSEARKYKLWLIVANQFTTQLDEKIRWAIFGNVGSIICMTIWYDDAQIMSNQFKWLVTTNDILSLPNRHAYIRLKIDGKDSDIFSMQTADWNFTDNMLDIKEKVRTQSRQRYAIAREELEKLIKIWAEKKFSPAEKVMEKAKAMAAEQTKNINTWKSSVEAWFITSDAKNNPKTDIYINNKNNLAPIEVGNISEIDKSDNINNIYISDNISNHSENSESSKYTEDRSIDNMKIWKWYEGLVKLKYNFWLFVTVLGVEWLLHKNFIVSPEWLSWKKVYNIWDQIKVKLIETKEIDGVMRAIWSQEGLE